MTGQPSAGEATVVHSQLENLLESADHLLLDWTKQFELDQLQSVCALCQQPRLRIHPTCWPCWYKTHSGSRTQTGQYPCSRCNEVITDISFRRRYCNDCLIYLRFMELLDEYLHSQAVLNLRNWSADE